MSEENPALALVATSLEKVGMPYAIVGSVAGSLWGLRRSTVDTDLMTIAAQDRVEELIACMSDNDTYFPIDEARHALRFGGSFNVLNLETLDKIDIYVSRTGDSFAASGLLRRVKATIQDVDTWVSTAEDIVLAKLRWRQQTRSERQWQDCCSIAAAVELDLGYMRKWADQLGLRDDLEDLIRAVSSIN